MRTMHFNKKIGKGESSFFLPDLDYEAELGKEFIFYDVMVYTIIFLVCNYIFVNHLVMNN